MGRTLVCAVATAFFATGCDRAVSDPVTESRSAAKTMAQSSPPAPKPALSSPAAASGRPHGARDPHGALTPDKHLQVALKHKVDGRPGEAMDVLARAIAAYPEHAGLLSARGALYLEQKRYSAALSDLEAAARLAPTDPAVLTNRAQAYRQFGRIDDALADLDRAIKIKPNFIPAHFNRGTVLFTRGNYRQALDDFDRCIAVDPHAAAPYFNRAMTQDALGEVARAIADLERFLQIADNEKWKGAAREILARWRARPAGGGATESNAKKGG
jgi:tetratricopeptide (TPR) repeat protein